MPDEGSGASGSVVVDEAKAGGELHRSCRAESVTDPGGGGGNSRPKEAAAALESQAAATRRQLHARARTEKACVAASQSPIRGVA